MLFLSIQNTSCFQSTRWPHCNILTDNRLRFSGGQVFSAKLLMSLIPNTVLASFHKFARPFIAFCILAWANSWFELDKYLPLTTKEDRNKWQSEGGTYWGYVSYRTTSHPSSVSFCCITDLSGCRMTSQFPCWVRSFL